MRDDHRLRHVERCHEIKRPPLQIARRLAAWWRVPGHIRRPGIEFGARNVVPAPPFPIAEMHLGETVIDDGLWMQQLGQFPATNQGAGPQRQPRRAIRPTKHRPPKPHLPPGNHAGRSRCQLRSRAWGGGSNGGTSKSLLTVTSSYCCPKREAVFWTARASASPLSLGNPCSVATLSATIATYMNLRFLNALMAYELSPKPFTI